MDTIPSALNSGFEWKADLLDETQLTVGKDCPTNKILAYFIGIDPGRSEGFGGWLRGLFCDEIGTGDFVTLADWIRTKSGADYNFTKL